MKKISTYVFQYKWGYLLGLIAMIISVSLDMLSPQIDKYIVDDVILDGQIELLPKLLLGILMIGVGRFIFQYVKEYLFDMIGTKIAFSLREELFSHIQGLSANFFDKTNTGELMSRVKDDVDRIWEALTFVVMLVIEIIFHTSIVLFCMYQLNSKLAIIPTIAMILCGIIALYMERKLGSVYEAISEQNAELNTVAEENLSGVRTVKAFAREKHEIKKFLSHNKKYYDLNMQQSKVFVKYYPYFQVISKLLPIIIILAGGHLVIKGEMSLGALTAFMAYSTNIIWPMEMLGWLTNSVSAGFASSRKIKAIFREEASILEKENPIILDNIKGSIEFKHVSFHKEDKHPILTDINFKLDPGKTIGIMGATGSGKTSIIHLLQRLYDTTDGIILLDGVNIKDLSLSQLRSNISLVMQDVFLFSETITENISLGGKERMNSAMIKASSHAAQASEFIESMEHQYDTVIGERGVGLSGGQKQRISIARALSKKSPILVLDDSTSALDTETEHIIWQTLNTLNDTTKIIITHRISAVRKADEIIVLDNGSIQEHGTHVELLALKGLYYETFIAQYGKELLCL